MDAVIERIAGRQRVCAPSISPSSQNAGLVSTSGNDGARFAVAPDAARSDMVMPLG